jgi:DNA-binding transcriptional MerR regulator
MPQKYYKAAQVAQALGICKKTLFNWEKNGRIPNPKRDKTFGYRIYTQTDVGKLKKMIHGE